MIWKCSETITYYIYIQLLLVHVWLPYKFHLFINCVWHCFSCMYSEVRLPVLVGEKYLPNKHILQRIYIYIYLIMIFFITQYIFSITCSSFCKRIVTFRIFDNIRNAVCEITKAWRARSIYQPLNFLRSGLVVWSLSSKLVYGLVPWNDMQVLLEYIFFNITSVLLTSVRFCLIAGIVVDSQIMVEYFVYQLA